MHNTESDSLAEKLISLSEVTSLTSVGMSEKQLMALFASKLHELFSASAFALWTFDKDKRSIKLRYGHDLSEPLTSCCLAPVPVEQFPEVKLAIDSGAVWTTEDLNDAPLYDDQITRKLLTSMNVSAVMGVPLRALTNLIGALSFYYKTKQHFSPGEKALALAYANALALSLNNIDSYDRLAALEKTKGEVIHIVAHQFRTPIAILRGNVELLKDKKVVNDPETYGQIVSELEKVGDKLRTFVETFLNVKAIDEGNLQPKPKTVDANTLIQQVVRDMETYRQNHNIALTLTTLPDPAMISVDPMLVAEAFTNVVNNAIKYAKTKAHIEMKREGNEVVISVADDGVGIPQNEQQLIFHKMYRATNVARHPEASSGLGLYIAQRYINTSGGRVWFTSQGEGKGTTFYIAFPQQQ